MLKLLKENEGRYVIIAIPCQLEGIYSYIYNNEPELAERIHTVIGLSCGWYYNLHALKAICEYKKIDYDGITNISYRGGGAIGKLRITSNGKETAVSRRIDFDYQVAFDRSFNIPRCHFCINHVNYFADVVVADAWLPCTVGTKTGTSLVICRKSLTTESLKKLTESGRIRIAEATVDDIVDSQMRRNAFGDFAYAYAKFMKDNTYSFNILKKESINYSEKWKNILFDAFNYSGEELAKLHVDYGKFLGELINNFITKNDIENKSKI